MSGIRLDTLVKAHAALMAAWSANSSKPISSAVQHLCMESAAALQVELHMLGITVPVVADATTEKAAA